MKKALVCLINYSAHSACIFSQKLSVKCILKTLKVIADSETQKCEFYFVFPARRIAYIDLIDIGLNSLEFRPADVL